jgi:hypothetical protein
MAKIINLPVRFYFSISISCLIPSNPSDNVDEFTDVEWERLSIRKLEAELEGILSEHGLEIAYVSHKSIKATYRLFAARFTVSRLHSFHNAEVSRRDGKVKKTALEKTKIKISNQIIDTLKPNYVVTDISYKCAVSRTFQFMILFHGDIEISHQIDSADVADVGSVRDAIEMFFDQLTDCAAECGYEIYPDSSSAPSRRPKNHIYKFTILREAYLTSPEDEVICSNFAALNTGVNYDHLEELDFTKNALSEFIQWERDVLERMVEWEIGQKYTVLNYALDFIDYDEDYTDFHYDYTDGLK